MNKKERGEEIRRRSREAILEILSEEIEVEELETRDMYYLLSYLEEGKSEAINILRGKNE